MHVIPAQPERGENMIICKNCGAELPDNAKFCTKCGYAVLPEEELRAAEEAQPASDDWNAQAQQPAYNPYAAAPQYQAQPQYQQNQYQPQQADPYGYQGNAAYDPYKGNAAPDQEKNDLGRSAMILAIIGAVLSELGIPGIILCAIAKGKVKAWEAKYGPAAGMAKAAKIISTVGMVFSIIMTVFWVIYLFVIIGLVAAGRSGALEDFLEDLFDLY